MSKLRLLPASGQYLLIVEDVPCSLTVLLEVLSQQGYAVQGAADGIDAMTLLRRGPLPYLILTDLNMPRMDGRELCAALAQDPQLKPIPLVLMSESPDVEEVARTWGAASWFRKPIDLRTLLPTIRRLCAADRSCLGPRTQGEPTPQARLKVLIVDDDRVQLAALQAWLEADGCEVLTHDSPFGTARMVAWERPDILLLDVSMPGLDGSQLAGMIQRGGRSPTTAIIFHSSQERTRLDALALEHGVLGAIPKSERGRAFLAEFRCLADQWVQLADSRQIRRA